MSPSATLNSSRSWNMAGSDGSAAVSAPNFASSLKSRSAFANLRLHVPPHQRGIVSVSSL